MKCLFAAMILAFAVSASSCGTDAEDAAPKETASKEVPCPAPAEADDPFNDAALNQAVKRVKIPNDGKLINSQSVSNVDDKTMNDVVVRICAKGLSGDNLKDAATDIAWALKQSGLNKKIASLRITNMASDSDPAYMVRCEDFQMYTFDKKAADPGALRASWKHPNE